MKIPLYALDRILPAAFLLLAAALLTACGGGQSPRGASTPKGETAGVAPASTRTPVENVPKIVAFGDSLTAGYGLAPRESYPALLQKMLDEDGFRYEVVNAGESGGTSAGGVRRLDWALEAGDVRFLILELGANDFLRGQPVAETKKNLDEIIRRAQSRGVHVLLAGMLTTTEFGRDYEAEIRDAYRSLADEHEVTLIPFFLEGVAGIDRLNQQDRIHPNVEGTRIVATNVYRHLKPLLEKDGKK
ncbi:MAG: arylesterase [Acidobacteria bacterium]|nr:arylesterase [Acidobacteriota bacterium]